jgi:hypothetical protein
MLRFRTNRSDKDVLVRDFESAVGPCIATTVLRESPDDPEALDTAVEELRSQADLLGGSGDPDDLAAADELDALERRLTARSLQLQGVDAKDVRRRSLSTLAHAGLTPSPERVPLLLEHYAGLRRDEQAAVDRVRALMAVLHAVHGASAMTVGRSVQNRGLLPWLTPQERTFLVFAAKREKGDPELEQHRAWIGRRVEGLHALGWALGLLPDLGATGYSEVHPDTFRPVRPADAAGDPADDVQLRPRAELVARLDVLTCALRAVQEQELRGAAKTLPPDVVPGVIAERRRALEWVLTREPWDDLELEFDVRAERG